MTLDSGLSATDLHSVHCISKNTRKVRNEDLACAEFEGKQTCLAFIIIYKTFISKTSGQHMLSYFHNLLHC